MTTYNFSRELFGEPEVDYEVIKLHLKDTLKEQLADAQVNYLRQFGAEESYPLNIDVDQCETLKPSMDVDKVPAREICTIRQLSEFVGIESTCYEVRTAINYTRTIFQSFILLGALGQCKTEVLHAGWDKSKQNLPGSICLRAGKDLNRMHV